MKNILLLILFTSFSVSVFAQKGEKLRAAKIEFIKKKLALTEDEKTKFIPLYEKFLDEMETLRKGFKNDVDIMDVDLTFMTDAECEKLITDIIDFKQKEVDLIKKHTAEFKKVLPIKKVAMVFKAEVEFKKELVKKLKGWKKDKEAKPNEGDE